VEKYQPFCDLQLKSLDANQPRTGKSVRLHTNNSYFSLSFRYWDCTANGWELRGLNLQFNIQSRLAMWSTIHITGFLGEVFESAAADKWPEVTRWMTRRITWSWFNWLRNGGQNEDRTLLQRSQHCHNSEFRHISISTRQQSLRCTQNLCGPFLRATLPMRVESCAQAMADNGETKGLITPPSRWVSAQLLYVCATAW